MTKQTSPITPPPELVQQWFKQAHESADPDNYFSYYDFISTAAAQWGADQELEACCEWMQKRGLHPEYWRDLRDARRPKPPSLKEQAYDALDTYIYGEPDPKDKERTYNTIRQALEALPND